VFGARLCLLAWVVEISELHLWIVNELRLL